MRVKLSVPFCRFGKKYAKPKPPFKKNKISANAVFALSRSQRCQKRCAPKNTCAPAKSIGSTYAKRSGAPSKYRLEEMLSDKNGYESFTPGKMEYMGGNVFCSAILVMNPRCMLMSP